MLLSVTASIFVVFNSYLYCRLLTNIRKKAFVSFGTVLLIVSCVIGSNFNWKHTMTFDIVFIVTYVCILCGLVIVFGYIQNNISEELIAETKLHFNQ